MVYPKESEEDYFVCPSHFVYPLKFKKAGNLLFLQIAAILNFLQLATFYIDHLHLLHKKTRPSTKPTFFKNIRFPPRLSDCTGLMGDSSATSNRIKLRDGRFLAYKEGGVSKDEAKFKIIFVHGFLSSKNMITSASKDLIEELGVYFILYDRSGYGESDPNAKHSLKSEVDDIAELADQLEIGPKFYLVGFSMGSYPAWGCLKYIPHRLSGVAFVAPAVNYRWPSLPDNLIKKDHRRLVIKWFMMLAKYAPGLLHWSVIQKLFQSTSSVLISNVVYVNSLDLEVLKRPTTFPIVTKDRKTVFLDTIRNDFVACFEQWDFEPADLSISKESSVHIWHGKKDNIVPVQLQRCILQKQPLINYHEIPQGGHLIAEYDGTCDAVLRALLLEEEENLYKPILNSPFDGNMYQEIDLSWGLKQRLLLFCIFCSFLCSYFFY